MYRFDGQVVIVTGAAHGIGRGIAAAFHGAGAVVHAFDVDIAGLAAAGRSLEGSPERYHCAVVDVSRAESIEK
ncbi:MAG TPA: SDR family NAD(P)-dependent oxidoreductase, partial [Steroidobacteraceae bacterium]|nr:SDR family NAD(P)-dependent oxidoreductase [Steroidobacteraceae bacterium]